MTSFQSPISNHLWFWGELGTAVDGAIFNVGNAAVGKDIAVAVGDAEDVGAGAHAGVGLDKVVIAGAGNVDPLAVG